MIILSYEGTKPSENLDGEDEEVISSESKLTKAKGKNSKDKVCLDQSSDAHSNFYFQHWNILFLILLI